MKKHVLAAAVLVVALGATACSERNNSTLDTSAPTTQGTTQAPTTTASVETTQEEDDYVEEDYVTGIITNIQDQILTVKDNQDSSEKKYDISSAEISQEYPFSKGDTVEITFASDNTKDPVPAIGVDVMESIIGLNTDPSISGTVTEATDTTLTMKTDEGETCTVSIANAYIVAKDGITLDKKATITYIGDLDDNAMAVKVVMEDSYGSAETERSAFIGKVIQNTDNNLVLESADSDFYTFVSDDLDFSPYQIGDTVQIFYNGTITSKEITALEVSKK